MKFDVFDLSNKKVGSVDLSDSVFAAPVRSDIMNDVVKYQLAKRQAGTHQTKGISQISGTTRKPWRQKGTGRARFGSLRAPQFRGGATIFGPQARSHAFKLNKKVRALGLKSALSAKAASKELIIMDSFTTDSAKTKEIVQSVKALNSDKILFVDADTSAENFIRSSSNIKGVNFLPSQGLNVYDILRSSKLVMTKAAAEAIEARLK